MQFRQSYVSIFIINLRKWSASFLITQDSREEYLSGRSQRRKHRCTWPWAGGSVASGPQEGSGEVASHATGWGGLQVWLNVREHVFQGKGKVWWAAQSRRPLIEASLLLFALKTLFWSMYVHFYLLGKLYYVLYNTKWNLKIHVLTFHFKNRTSLIQSKSSVSPPTCLSPSCPHTLGNH